MIPKKLQDIQEEDLYALMQEEVIECRTLDYKLHIQIEDKYPNSRESRREFLRDLCAFANTDGGDLIIGIREEKGSPIEIAGMMFEDIDSFKLLCDNLIIDGIEPNIPYDIKTVRLREAGHYVVIIRVYRNWVEGPFRVCYKNENRFYGRQSSRKYELDMSELRSRFNYTIKIKEEIERIRESSIRSIYKERLPVNQFIGKPKLVIHLIPLSAFEKRISMDSVTEAKKHLLPLNHKEKEISSKYNFDGYLTVAKNQANQETSYIQIYENGVLEIVDGELLSHNYIMPIVEIEKELIHKIKHCYLPFLKEIKTKVPIFLYVSLLNVRGFTLEEPLLEDKLHKIDREVLLFEQIALHDFKEQYDVEKVLRPIFETLWRSFGVSRDYCYNETGNYEEASCYIKRRE